MAYSGAYGRRQQQRPAPTQPPPGAGERPRPEKRPPHHGEDKLSGAVGALMRKLESMSTSMETDDLIMALILYLMYRESGDKDLLIMLGAMLLT